jgi:hypothetical protein
MTVSDRELGFQALFEAAPGLYLVLDPDLVIVTVTDAYAAATMTRREDILGRSLFEVFPDNPDDPVATGVANLRASLDRVRSELVSDTMAVQKYDIRRPESEGGGFEERYWSPLNTPVLDATGRLTHIIHRVEDVTEFVRLKTVETELLRVTDELRSHAAQIEAEVLARAQEISAANRALQRANADLERFFSLSSDMFGVFNLDGTFRRVNAAWESILGYAPEDLIGHPFLDFVHPDDIDRTVAEFERATDEGSTTTEFENRYRHRDGSYRWLDWTGRLIPDEGVHYSAARDVTERKGIELALGAARDEADRANNAKSQFLSRMSHELRTPLTAVLGFSELLARDDLTEDQQESVRYIARAGRHLLELINEVLDLSRIESGNMSISPEPVAVAGLLGELVGLIRPMADGASISLLPNGADCTIFVLADRQRLKQVLLNLLSNAVKYNRQGGHITIHCARIAGDRVRVSVSDSGFGIPPDQIGRLFQPFVRLDTEQVIEGTGMGLALSKGLVEAMGGTIGVESELDTGTTFWIELAATTSQLDDLEPAPRTRRSPIPALPAGRTRTVLHIEDNHSNLRLVERILAARPDIALISAMQGSLGAELAREHRPDLILLDLHLPDSPGREILQRLRTFPETRGIPIIVISADATRSQMSSLMEGGATAYLTKPLDVPAFLETIGVILDAQPAEA